MLLSQTSASAINNASGGGGGSGATTPTSGVDGGAGASSLGGGAGGVGTPGSGPGVGLEEESGLEDLLGSMGGDGDFNILAYTDADLELGGEKDIFDEHLGIKVRRIGWPSLNPV